MGEEGEGGDVTFLSVRTWSFTVVEPCAYFACSCLPGIRPLVRGVGGWFGMGTRSRGSVGVTRKEVTVTFGSSGLGVSGSGSRGGEKGRSFCYAGGGDEEKHGGVGNGGEFAGVMSTSTRTSSLGSDRGDGDDKAASSSTTDLTSIMPTRPEAAVDKERPGLMIRMHQTVSVEHEPSRRHWRY